MVNEVFRLEIQTDGAAFRDFRTGESCEFAEAWEIKRILEEVIVELKGGRKEGSVMDINGNKVGSWAR